ncbi:MAG TPA: alpha/beta hydrolase [Syntrophomonadaceae bacterium]|nr:alpha/beta hydrolase [Syntrophomonadaceae bacterium]HOQ09759.1 alpha/beta hydrolase [Syntrophomonadaceae bacterium]
MKFKSFGDKDLPTFVLLHGGGLSWWSLQGIVYLLRPFFYVITPIIDGHGEAADETFISIEDSAHKLIHYIDCELGGKVFILGGLSLGAQIALEVLSLREDLADFAVVESALVHPLKGLTALTTFSRLSYRLIQKRWFARLQAKALFVPASLYQQYYEDSLKMSLPSLTNILLSNGRYQLKDTIRLTKSKVLVIVGEKELPIMKKSALTLNSAIPGSTLYTAPGLKHGEFSLGHPREYVRTINTFINHRSI